MAIYHLSVKTISRSDGRSATAAAAYRAGVEITDERTGEVHDYRRKRGVESAELVLPAGAPEWAADRAALWNAAEQAETRKNSTVAREFEIALPSELSPAERQRLARDFAREIVERHGCAVDVSIHAPSKEGDNRNYHAHILLSTRRLGPEGFTEKTRELDDRKTGPQIVTQWRERFAILQNERLRENGISARVDHRSYADQGLNVTPTRHIGRAAVAMARRGLTSDRFEMYRADREKAEREWAAERKAMEERQKSLDRLIARWREREARERAERQARERALRERAERERLEAERKARERAEREARQVDDPRWEAFVRAFVEATMAHGFRPDGALRSLADFKPHFPAAMDAAEERGMKPMAFAHLCADMALKAVVERREAERKARERWQAERLEEEREAMEEEREAMEEEHEAPEDGDEPDGPGW